MDQLALELNIPRKQIRPTKHANRCTVLAHRDWLASLLLEVSTVDRRFPEFRPLTTFRSEGDDWSTADDQWQAVHLTIHCKHSHNVIPLAPLGDNAAQTEPPLGFSGLLQAISNANHQHLWKAAYKQYAASRPKTHPHLHHATGLPHDNNCSPATVSAPSAHSLLAPYETVQREALSRLYARPIVQLHSTASSATVPPNSIACSVVDPSAAPRAIVDAHPNLYAAHAIIETPTSFYVLHSDRIATTLLDCIAYSPAILARSHNRPLFLIYQLLQLTHALHAHGLFVGDLELGDCFLTENLWLHVAARLEANLLLPATDSEPDEPPPVASSAAASSAQTLRPFASRSPQPPQYSMADYCEMWCQGHLSNFDYLTILNNLSGRRLGAPGSHHIMPWVSDLAARNGTNWRDLKKSKYRLNKGDAQLDQMFAPGAAQSDGGDAAAVPHHVSDVLSEITFYVYMARRTPKAVLCRYVRPIWVPAEYPVSIQRLQQWTPDECIPEFFTEPSVFKSVHEDLADLEVPAWASCPEDFVAKHREALESQHVSDRLHHWIDLNFGYKLSGAAAVKAKNVCLSLVNEHKSLSERGVVQLFSGAHPPRRPATAWTQKTPPRMYTQSEVRRRLTRSTEDLCNAAEPGTASAQATLKQVVKQSPRVFQSPAAAASNMSRLRSPSTGSSRRESSMERSTSYHTAPVQRSTPHQIQLPRDYNPVATLTAVESMEQFLCKTFHRQSATAQPLQRDDWFHEQASCNQSESADMDTATSFTNRLFSETFDELFLHSKDSKRLLNVQQRNQLARKHHSRRNFQHRLAEQRAHDLQVLGCLVVELFAADRLRPLGALTGRLEFSARLAACLTVLKHHPDALPRCVRYPVRLLFQLDNAAPITQYGLPPPSAQQLLQPLLGHALFPFPLHYAKVYTALAALRSFDETSRELQHRTQLAEACDGSDCARHTAAEHDRMLMRRRVAECKVMAFTAQIERLLEPQGYEQFGAMELVLPHVVDLLRSDETAILTAWFLFDSVAVALGPASTVEHLLQPILRLFDADPMGGERVAEGNAALGTKTGALDAMESSRGHRGRKTGKLYHHSFLLRLIVRFGLDQFLTHFVAPLIEAVGGCKDHSSVTGASAGQRHAQQHHGGGSANNSGQFVRSRSTNFNSYEYDGSFDLPSVVPPPRMPQGEVEPRGDSVDTEEEMFLFDDDAVATTTTKSTGVGGGSITDDDYDANAAILKIMDQLDPTLEGSVLDLRLNASMAEECTETTPLVEYQLFEPSTTDGSSGEMPEALTSPTIPIPSFRRSTELNTIDCEIGSKKSFDSAEFLDRPVSSGRAPIDPVAAGPANESRSRPPARSRNNNSSSVDTRHGIADTASESLLWLSHRLGPVLTARHLTRNLLKMLTLCYVGQENLLPADAPVATSPSAPPNLATFSISDGRVVGDASATKVLECLAAVSALFGDQFVLRQYLPHIAEIVALCRRRITNSLEGGLIGSLQLLKYLVPCLNDRTVMEQLPETLLGGIVHPLIRLLGSGRFVMPSGFLARSVLARKFLDAVYVLAVRIGPEMTKDHLCVPAMQRFFLIFDKAYGVDEQMTQFSGSAGLTGSPSASSDDSCVRGSPVAVHRAKTRIVDAPQASANLTPTLGSPLTQRRAQAHEEICDVFDPSLAHAAYVTFLHYLGEYVMTQCVKNLPLILSLCHTFEQPSSSSNAPVSNPIIAPDSPTSSRVHSLRPSADSDSLYSNSFGTTVVGNRLEVIDSGASVSAGECDPALLLDACTYKYDQINTARHLRGNWLAYWEHECGRPDQHHAPFNVKQIKLQTFAGHTSSVKSLLCLDNENSFMSASKDRTVKLWSLRSEGDGSKVSQCQFTYTGHRKSVHSLAFLEALRLTVSCDSGVHMWDPFVGTQVGQLDSNRLTPVSVVRAMPAPSALVLAGTAEATVRAIDARTMAYVTEWRLTAVGGSAGGSVRCVAVAPSGAWLACGLSSGQLIVLDRRTGMMVASWRATDGELLQLLAPNDAQVVSSSLDSSVCVWSSVDGALLFQMKNPPEPAHCILSTAPAGGQELLFGTPSNRIGVYAKISRDAGHSITTKLRSETFKGVLTSMALLPLNRMLLVGGDSGVISLIC